ncbi:hypothetical protein A3G67_00300 [Candidatus Roizmanbacteria bacterium RIFCSPLOWO2_12_FULL_40_12]|uniref:Cohesin domain-containing protein n=1 Tax=Candidatus Roizmanbacteria bacterium RIFCSPLOWO2_01_FULL_40_42 TaxID=1802066 RepID=A0A1F7J6J4_9BACT|nr:MAG: hypothetical protein A2779_02520 [Candidatus Roizmanbacteria bacterium RIFCSPHIGHO2_01_FULL_40_98]OGK29317.1 MAG: hypothetical protein A2W49_05075 [Candidatus Roizmanbacteria bacterium RIFCSPHIGHO2_12_41_18]OGK36016.1 MAG: hypothetical protein A3E69_03165 [Candidatus Roizmanbacteria bacterium RIFCSPHIGHO2_12_FULL_40_130]OGK51213.1 MAG: hypothetical protein A3B50_03275 [Candidatus Roizmanbacteria bacterium RIFCSPLOWO2_01_FULL_40_42]OGK58507.1 MAG: hypothetical protein A3H84_04580 [Candid
MDSQNQPPHPNYRLFISIIALLAIGIWLVSVYLYRLKQDREDIPAVPVAEVLPPAPTTAITKGAIELAQQRANPQVGQPFELTVTANSDKKDVVGYDVLLKFDESAWTYNSATSLIPSFTLVPVVRGGLISMTASKSPQVNTPTVFSNTDVVRVTFTAKKKGGATFTVLPSFGNQKTRMVDANLLKINPRTSSIKVGIN